MVSPADTAIQTTSSHVHKLRVEVRSLADGNWAPAERVWQEVFARVPGASPFVAPEWTKAWVEVYGAAVEPDLLVFRDSGDAAVGVCLISQRTRYAGMIAHTRAHLNTDGEPRAESVVVEHNAVLAVPGQELAVATELATFVEDSKVDEFVAAGIDEVQLARLLAAFPAWRSDIDWRIAPYVDLEKLRANGGDHLRTLSSNTRQQLRRSIARYKERGDLHVEVAATADDGERLLGDMIELHEARWRARGSPGGFQGTLRRRFHSVYVRAGVATGAVQMLRVAAGDATIGILYNIVANGRVNFYQSGLRYEEQSQLKPGLVTHHLAIAHCLAAGMREYDFLVSGPDDGRYKTSLAGESRRLGWLQLSRPGWRQAYFDALRAARDFVRSRPGNPQKS